MPIYSGYTEATPENLLLDAGAFFKNGSFDPVTEEFTGILLGATRGGGEFNAKATMRKLEIDGIKGDAKGGTALDNWEIDIKANILEITADTLALALGTGAKDASSMVNYDIVTASNSIDLTDYINNICWVGRLSGSLKPVVIMILNALSTDGIKLSTKDKDEAVLPVTFKAHYDAADLDSPPFKIYWPKSDGIADITAPTLATNIADAAIGVAVGTNFVWTFSEEIDTRTVKKSNFILTNADGTVVAGALTVDATKKIVTFDPTANLSAATAYVALVTTNVTDIYGNALAANNIVNFTTA